MSKSWSQMVMGEDYDLFPEFDAPGASIRYVIIGTPRSGTNLLSSMLYKMGYGVPAEYHNDYMLDNMIKQRGFQGPADYYTGLFGLRTSADGVFGCKTVQPNDLPRIKMSTEPNFIIRMGREDKEAQAQSFLKSMKTKQYIQIEGGPKAPEVLTSDEEVHEVRMQIEQMDQFFDNNIGQGHTLISYEYLVQNTDEVLRHLAKAFGDELPEDWTHPSPVTQKMARDASGAIDLSMVVS